jgi:hypothetical protein
MHSSVFHYGAWAELVKELCNTGYLAKIQIEYILNMGMKSLLLC